MPIDWASDGRFVAEWCAVGADGGLVQRLLGVTNRRLRRWLWTSPLSIRFLTCLDLMRPRAVRRCCMRPRIKPVLSNSAMTAITASANRTSLAGTGWMGRGLAGRNSCGTTAEGAKSLTIFHDIKDNASKCLARAVAAGLAALFPLYPRVTSSAVCACCRADGSSSSDRS